MLSMAFDKAFRALVGAFKRHQDAPRTPDAIAELGAARWHLELARNDMTRERVRIEPDWPQTPFRKFDVSDANLRRLKVVAAGSGAGRT